ncbi:MAG: hypothetical protein HeimC3_54420 [Candidatus Heimdallarchaeota archaeon LC_3]|nr:MAG: hypothetical protein HeimC3_54420 [Candidatus Heimdallarchaeota archaeon LC_3]
MNTISTGNSKRNGNPEYEQPPQTGTSTISVAPGIKSKKI